MSDEFFVSLHPIMRLFRRVWAVYGVVLFLLLLLLASPVIVFNMITAPGERALQRNIAFLYHGIGPLFLLLIGVRVVVEGREKLDKNTSYIIVGNHRSALDFIVNAAAFPGTFRFLAKEELKKIPIFGWVVRKLCLTVDRSSTMSRARSTIALKQELAAGWSIFIYPEGGRNRTEAPLLPFYDGAFRLALQTGAPIAVQTIVNMEKLTAAASPVDLCPGTVRVIWETPIQTNKQTDAKTLRDQVEKMMLNRLRG
jgi:1-acyl-sn-glycerol-3-phosphate acyltransferase